MRITIELDPADLTQFHAALERAGRIARSADALDIVAAAKQALNTLAIGSAPQYVRKRMVEVQRLILMLEDETWALSEPERDDVLQALVYFSDPEDLIPDDVEVVGLLDDAIVLELLLRRLRHVLKAYADFCAFRATLGPAPSQAQARLVYARRLTRRREALQARMRRRACGDARLACARSPANAQR